MKHCFFRRSARRLSHPRVDAFMSTISSAMPLGDRADSRAVATVGHPSPPPLQFAANTYRLPEILFTPLSLLVSDYAADVLIRHKATVELYPAKFEQAFFLPFEPGSAWHLRTIGPSTELLSGVYHKVLGRYQVDPPSKKYYEVAMKRTGDQFEPDRSQFETKSIDPGAHYEAAEFDIDVADSWTKNYKLYCSGAYVCNEGLFEELLAMLPFALTYSGFVD